MSKSLPFLFCGLFILFIGSAAAQDSEGLDAGNDFLQPRIVEDTPPNFPDDIIAPPDETPETQQEIESDAEALLSAPQEESAPGNNPYEDVPDDYLREAIAYQEECESSSKMSNYYDCRCMSAEYLDRRIEMGERATPSAIKLSIGTICADGTGIAGDLYEDCRSDFARDADFEPGTDPEEFCSCYGNTYAKLYESYGKVLNSNDHVRLMTTSRLVCSRPERAQRYLQGRF